MEYKEKKQRMKVKAEYFIDNSIRAFIVDISGNYDFCDILLTDNDSLTYYCFAGKRSGQKIKQLWADIKDIKEYREFEEWTISGNVRTAH